MKQEEKHVYEKCHFLLCQRHKCGSQKICTIHETFKNMYTDQMVHK